MGELIPEKAQLGLGNVFVEQLLFYKDALPATRKEYARQAEEHYRRVITEVDAHDEPSAGSINRKAWAYYGLGLVYAELGECTASFTELQHAKGLTADTGLDDRLAALEKYRHQNGCADPGAT